MMYGPYGFAADPFRPTISTLDRNLQSTIGQRTGGPSFLDIQAVVECSVGQPDPGFLDKRSIQLQRALQANHGDVCTRRVSGSARLREMYVPRWI